MILMVSGRTDIVAFYTKWFMNRYKEGFWDVRNPFNPKLVSRIYKDNVDAIMFCTKNPLPILLYLKDIDKPILFHITLTPYGKDIEPNVIAKGKIIDAVKKVSKIVGVDNTVVRYDPIFINDKYNIEYHIKSFENLCSKLEGYINTIVVSFIDDYKNVRKNKKDINYIEFNEKIYEEIGKNFSLIASKYNMKVQTCYEGEFMLKYGFVKGECLSKELAYKLTGKKFSKWKARNCNCVELVDIGVYNSCKHFCKYCYANFDEKQVINNFKNHDPNSSLLVGELENDDVIKIRKEK